MSLLSILFWIWYFVPLTIASRHNRFITSTTMALPMIMPRAALTIRYTKQPKSGRQPKVSPGRKSLFLSAIFACQPLFCQHLFKRPCLCKLASASCKSRYNSATSFCPFSLSENSAGSPPFFFPFHNIHRSYKRSASASHTPAAASLGIRRSPRGDTATDPTFGPSGRQERLNCCEKKRR